MSVTCILHVEDGECDILLLTLAFQHAGITTREHVEFETKFFRDHCGEDGGMVRDAIQQLLDRIEDRNAKFALKVFEMVFGRATCAISISISAAN